MRILIAEDDATSRTLLVGVLHKFNHQVIAVDNGGDAWDVLKQPDSPRLAILDWTMPEMDGTDVIRLVRSLRRDPPPYLIMLTAWRETNNIMEALSAGANDYITKPFLPDELIARVDAGLRMLTLQDKLLQKVNELEIALGQVKTLRGILPICTHCKKIRNECGCWQQAETYVHERTEADFSHGFCPSCMEELYPEALFE